MNWNILKNSRFLSNLKLNQSRLKHTCFNLNNYRSLIRINGVDSSLYLQNLITNDIHLLNETDKKCLYAMMLNNRGRLMYDVLVYMNQMNDYFLELDSRYVQDAIKLLKLFKVKKKVELIKMDSAEFNLYHLIDFNDLNSSLNLSLNLNLNLKNNLIQSRDPRYSKLGFRVIANVKDNKKIGDYINDIEETNDLNIYRKHLYQNGIAENNDDFKQGYSIPLEYNLVFLNGVSFDKGCYLGQELIAKTHHTGVIRKRIMPIRILNRSNDSVFNQDNLIINTKSGANVGKLKNLIDNVGIAMLRLSNIDKDNLVLLDNNQNKFKIEIQVPKYWPLNDPSLKDFKFLF